MTRRRRVGCWMGLVAFGAIGGCGGLPSRKSAPAAHASASMLDTGPTTKVSKKGSADIQFAIGRGQEEGGQLDMAETAYRSALTKDSKRSDIETRLAIVLDRKGKAKEADEHFEKALKLDPKNPELLSDRGYCFYLRGKNADAEKMLRAALTLSPNDPRSHTNLGLVLAARGDSDAAIAEFGRAGTDPADSRSNLALALAMGGKIEAARDQYAQALKAKPKSTSATEGLRVASSVLKAGSTQGKKLPTLPGDPTPAVIASTPTAPASRVDPAVIPTSIAR